MKGMMKQFEKCQRVLVLLITSLLVATTWAVDESYIMNVNLTDGKIVTFTLTSQRPSVYCNNGQMIIYYYDQESQQYLNLSFERDLLKDLTFNTTSALPVPIENSIMFAPDYTPVLIDDIDRVTFEADTDNNVTTGDNSDVLKVIMRDGSIYKKTCGKNTASISFYKYTPCDNIYISTTKHQNDYTVEWNVNGVGKKDGCYSVGIYWYGNLFDFKNNRSGICFGTSPNLTVEQSEFVQYVNDSTEFHNKLAHYMFIGSELSLPMYLQGCNYRFENQIGEDNWLKTPLEYGKTYYYRTFSQVEMMQHGEMKPVTFYDVEKSFRVPKVLEDAGYKGFPIPTEEACKTFWYHFPDSVTAPSREQIIDLWHEWQQTDDAQQIDLSSYCTPIEFDNGTAYELNRIPYEFYKWLTHREIVIDVYRNIAELSKKATVGGDSIESIRPQVISDVNPSWNIPNNRYVRFEELVTTMNHSVKYRSNEVVPGIPYKLQITFAPETRDVLKLPLKVDIDAFSMYGNEGVTLKTRIITSETEVTTLEIDNIDVTSMGFDLRIRTNVSAKEVTKHIFTREMRIADIRLIPMTIDTVATPTFAWDGDKLAISTTTAGADVYYSMKEFVTTPSGNGTLSSPYNVTALLQTFRYLPADSVAASKSYVRGVVSHVQYEYDTKYGNASFYISDDGARNNEFFGWRLRYLNGMRYGEDERQVKVGDEVLIYCDSVIYYRGSTYETNSNKSTLYGYEQDTSSSYLYAFTTPEPNTLYQGPIAVGTNVIVRAKAKKEGMYDSESAMLSISEEPYAVLSDDNTVLTFYYDNKVDVRHGLSVYSFSGTPAWYANRNKIATVVFDASFAKCTMLTTSYWFYGCTNLKSVVGIENLNTAYVMDMSYMFCNCSSLTILDVSHFDTSNVVDFTQTFYGCSSLTSLDVSNFNTSNVTSMSGMFSGCSSLTNLDVSKFNTTNVANMSYLFLNCSSLTNIDVSCFKTANVLNMRGMFRRCRSLVNIDLSSFNTSNVIDMESMFGQCNSLTRLDLSNFRTEKVTNIQNMFRQSPNLKTIIVGSEWSTVSIEQGDSLFYRCDSLVGGLGTKYDADHTNYTYAHIDGGPSNPGYFTLIEFGDYQILKQFYNESNGDNWIRQWKISDTPSSVENFSGVVIERGRIVEINLPNNNIDGAFPYILLSLPNLRKLDVSRNSFLDDIGTSATLFALQNPSIISNIKELNISNNKFSGNIGLFAKIFTQLETLDASKNCLETVFPMISPKVTSLNLSSQTINRVIDLHLANLSIAEVVTKLPTILIYDHKNQTFTPNINLFCSTADNSWNMALSYQNGQLTVPYVPEQNTYYGQSGDTFNVSVLKNDGTPEGSTFRIKLYFDEGDSNFDGQVNVLDLQTDINYIMEKYQKRPYNFTAANLWKDDLINIQDIICLVNLLINTENVGDEQSASARGRAMQMSDATVYVQNGQLMLNTTLPVAAFDITLSGADGINVTKDMERMGMTITKKVTHDGIRLIGYSMNGAYIPMGDTAIGTLSSNAACVRHAMLSDSEANGISVSVDANTTGIETVRMSSSESTEIYDLQGRKVNTMSHKGLYIMNGRKIIK